MTIFVGNTTEFEVTLTDSDDSPITDAVATVTITDTAGTPVSGQSWPTTLVHQGAGVYLAIISADADFVAGKRYKAEVTGTSGTSVVFGERFETASVRLI